MLHPVTMFICLLCANKLGERELEQQTLKPADVAETSHRNPLVLQRSPTKINMQYIHNNAALSLCLFCISTPKTTNNNIHPSIRPQ
jgi:hypothetical protein